ncbi:MAG TPA: hypothetical protein VLQ20_10210 [Planococcus sp. (in: firmicutes)]|nr:hypothetical protein [Planococcus sp. (in: firmicutes)]
MIRIHNTPNFAGVHITGDYWDFDELYEAGHHVIRSHEEDDGYGQPRRRILWLFSEMRQAQLGNRGIEAVPNGFSGDDALLLPMASAGNNVYLRFEALWPEILFAAFALNDFIGHFTDSEGVHNWNPSVAAVRKFQSAVARCLEDTLSPNRYRQLRKYIDPHGLFAKTKYQNYLVQYIDRLNIQFLRLPPERRSENISIMAKRICELDSLYYNFRSDFIDLAEGLQVHVSKLRYKGDYPDDIEW